MPPHTAGSAFEQKRAEKVLSWTFAPYGWKAHPQSPHPMPMQHMADVSLISGMALRLRIHRASLDLLQNPEAEERRSCRPSCHLPDLQLLSKDTTICRCYWIITPNACLLSAFERLFIIQFDYPKKFPSRTSRDPRWNSYPLWPPLLTPGHLQMLPTFFVLQ